MAAHSPPDPIDIEVGLRILTRRKHLRFSQAELANALGVTFQQVQKYERAANRVSASMLVRIAAKLQTTVAVLIGEHEDEDQRSDLELKLSTPGAIDLLQSYAALPRDENRRALVALAQTWASGA